ncbi:MAG: diaminopimelate decarboxylase [Bryobacteraceae bacterium]|nr:diaminopimelate decarboxylase [Bryobacteraceae bacterium]
MDFLGKSFSYRQGSLYCGNTRLSDVADEVGTPCYLYSATDIVSRFNAYAAGLEGQRHRICYAVKANSNLAVLGLLARAGAGFDIVSGGELFRVLKAGGSASAVVFSGVGKTADEIDYALREGIHSFNCESEAELVLISSLAAHLGKRASVAVRVNPDVDASTHPYISTGLREHKFGIDISEVQPVYERARALPGLILEGVSCHIGSQLLDAAPLVEAAGKMLALVDRLRSAGFPIRYFDLGGGLGVPYKPSDPRPDASAFLASVKQLIAGKDLSLLFEPGRSIVAEAGALLSRVLYRKRNGDKEFIVIDAAMTELIRPALYGAYHEIVPLRETTRPRVTADVVGPVCETGDFLGQARPLCVQPGDLLAVMSAGAYGMAMASNYNTRPRAVEVMVDGDAVHVIRQRETVAQLYAGEQVLPV